MRLIFHNNFSIRPGTSANAILLPTAAATERIKAAAMNIDKIET